MPSMAAVQCRSSMYDVTGENGTAVSRLICQTDHFVASIPFAKVARGRIIIAPRRHYACFEDSTEEELWDLAALLRLLMAALYRLRDDPSYNIYWETGPNLCSEHAPLNNDQRKTIERSFRWTLHVRLPRASSGFGLASGVEVTHQLPEQEARELRGAILQEKAVPLRAELFEGAPGPPDISELEFPAIVSPFILIPAALSLAFNECFQKHQFSKPDMNQSIMAGIDPCKANLAKGDILFCQVSPLHTITLDDEARIAARIPKDAEYYGWAYPVAQDGPDASEITGSRAADTAFLRHGGFIYFNESLTVVATNAVSPAAEGTSLIFKAAEMMPQNVLDILERQGRFQEITMEVFRDKGATHYAYIRPDEYGMDCPSGAFAFQFAQSVPKFFQVEGMSTRRPKASTRV